MKKALLSFFIFYTALFSSAQTTDYASLVNPLIGTDYKGNVYPGAQAPFGMVQLSPDNGQPGWDWIAGYFYPDSTIAGFSHTHLSGTGAGDLYDISFLPVTYPLREANAPLGIYSLFSHEREECEAGYYKVHLDSYGINVELTATERCGIQRYTYPTDTATVLLDLGKATNWDATVDTYIAQIDSFTIEGYRYSNGWARGQEVYFRTRFSQPIVSMVCDSITIADGTANKNVIGKATIRFYLSNDNKLTVVTAISGTGLDGAAKNLANEAPHDNFDAYRTKTRENWNSRLSRIEVKGGTDDERICFYTALYRTMLAPTLYCDVDGLYRGADGKNHKADGWKNYSTFSLWDTFRASHPLFTYTAPDCIADMINSFIAFYEQHGRLPVWNMWGSETDMMIGYHSVPVIADAYLKGIGGFDAERALAACVATANSDSYRGIGLYKEEGYVPYDVIDTYNADNWSMSRTLEYAYDDHCIARMAEAMGRDSIADIFYRRAKSYRNLYNPATTFMQPRDSKGAFQPMFAPEEYTPHICESNAWHYMWSVQHDIEGLMKLMGRKVFSQKLDSMFTHSPAENADLPIFSTGMIGQYAHGNEPSHHVAYLFNRIGKPERTQHYVTRIMREMYRNTPDGLCGNEDCGQMSAWYVMSAMGFYPVDPCGGEYEIGAPLFPEATLHLPDGKTFTVLCHSERSEESQKSHTQETEKGSSVVTLPQNDTVSYRKAYLNGKRVKGTAITHIEITNGGVLEFK
ncbi:MAG: GH92 family glycosyl hydrolase [Bacteroidaceae bacterium]|nr:GH92 family glycosyl hydrolase [Bacteroidaceae bacterium]